MRKLTLLLALVMAFFATASDDFKTYTIEQFMKTVSIRGGAFSPDETKLLVSSNESGIFNAYTVDIATGKRTPVTRSQDTTFTYAYFPHDERMILRKDNQGNELYHVYVRETDGTIKDLTGEDETKARETFGGFDVEGNYFYISSNKRDPRYMDLYELDAKTYESKIFYKNENGLNLAAVSNDKRWLALSKLHTRSRDDLFIMDRQNNGKPIMINKAGEEANYSAEGFSTDNKWLYYTTNKDHEFTYLMRYRLSDGKREEVRKADWGVSYHYFSHKGKYAVTGINWDGTTKLEIINTETGKPVALPKLPKGRISSVSFSRSEKQMRFYLSGDASPSNLYIYNFETKKLKRLSSNLSPEINADHLVESELVRFKARDGLEIPGYLYKPKQAADGKVPLIINVHGGPGGQSRPSYRAELQFLVNHGYAIYNINNRGSSGYGKSFFAADDGKHGREPLWDCIDAKNVLKKYDWIDEDKIGIMGGSYGGYMVLAALAFEPDEFEVGVDIFGVANWKRTLENIPPWWESARQSLYKEIGHPVDDAENLHAISPVFHGDKIKKPLMILQGANDPRVLKAESDDMVSAIRENKGVVEYVVFEDEGHGFTKNENRIEGFNKVLKFVDEHLKKEIRAF